MPTYHLNGKNEMGICRKTVGKCPFDPEGTGDNHFSDPDEAVKEMNRRNEVKFDSHTKMKKEKPVAPEPVKPQPPQPYTEKEFDKKYPYARQQYVVDPKNSGIIARPSLDARWVGFTGGKFKEETTVKQAASYLRRDLAKAVKEGELPDEFNYTVKVHEEADRRNDLEIVVSRKDGSKIPDSWMDRDVDRRRARVAGDLGADDRREIHRVDVLGGSPAPLQTDQHKQLRNYLEEMGSQYGEQLFDEYTDMDEDPVKMSTITFDTNKPRSW